MPLVTRFISLVSLAVLCSASGGFAQNPLHEKDGEIHRLPEKVARKNISLNPEYFVWGLPDEDTKKSLPLLIFLHGGGGVGLDIKRIARQTRHIRHALQRNSLESLFVAPQSSRSPMRAGGKKGGWQVADLDRLLEHLLETLPIDSDRIYLMGISMGGYGTLLWAGNRPQHFAAIAPMVGGLGPAGPKDITADLELWGRNIATIPMRAYYGAKDRVVPADRGEMIRNVIDQAGGSLAEVIILKDKGHDAASVPLGQPEFFKWLYSHRRR